MADDPRSDARDEQVASWLAVEPLDDVTRRRLVSTALRETGEPTRQPSRTWRWMAAAAAVVLVVVGTVAVVTAGRGNDEQQASTPVRTPEAAADSASPKALAGVPNVGDFGDLDQPANLTKLRDALDATPLAAAGASRAEASAGSQTSAAAPGCNGVVGGGTVLALGSGTLDGQPATVLLTELPDGSHSYDALVGDTCELRHLP